MPEIKIPLLTLQRVRKILQNDSEAIRDANTIKGVWNLEERGAIDGHEEYLDLMDLIGQVDVALARVKKRGK